MKKTLMLSCAFFLHMTLMASKAPHFWTCVSEEGLAEMGERTIVPQKYKVFLLLEESFKNGLFQGSSQVIELPLPDGSLGKFNVSPSVLMAPELAAQFPDIHTFDVQGIEDPTAIGKLDWTLFGFHGMIKTSSGNVYIDPYSRHTTSYYICYYASDFAKDADKILPESGVVETKAGSTTGILAREESLEATAICAGTKLRTYRLAVACTGEYAQLVTGLTNPTTAQILSHVVTSINRVSGVYETEVAIKLVLVAEETAILFANPGFDPFTGNADPAILIDESQTVIDQYIGSSNYDIGHTFSTKGGGLANVGCVCQSGSKARGITGSLSPTGDPYDIDYVAHEMGHEFGATHTFAANTNSCSGNGSNGTRVEPGSGVTIMAYAGICGTTNNLATHSIPYFHTISFDQIMSYTTNGAGKSCATTTTTTNLAPVVTAGITYNVPKSTAFELSSSATDPNGDVLTYQWEEIDNGTMGDWNQGTTPYFRSYPPTSIPSRLFPSLAVVLSGAYTTTPGEYVPTTAQTLNFRMTARDGNVGGGGVCYAASKVVIADLGPFEITYPNTTGIVWTGGSTQSITWTVNGTTGTPINCANVNLTISTDGGATFTPLLSSTTNDGSADITVPLLAKKTTTCRIKASGIGAAFFDINNFNFTINASAVTDISEEYDPSVAGIQVTPNPFLEEVTISAQGLSRDETSQLVMYDIVGREVLKETVAISGSFDKTYALSSFPKGVYTVEITNSKQKMLARLVKQ